MSDFDKNKYNTQKEKMGTGYFYNYLWKKQPIPIWLFDDGAGEDKDEGFVTAVQLGDADNCPFPTFNAQRGLNQGD